MNQKLYVRRFYGSMRHAMKISRKSCHASFLPQKYVPRETLLPMKPMRTLVPALKAFHTSSICSSNDKHVTLLGNSSVDDDVIVIEKEGKKYLGVVYDPSKVKKYSAQIEIDGHIISGGDYWTELDAAKAYDELVDLYCDPDTSRNFLCGYEEEKQQEENLASAVAPMNSSAWEIPDVGKRNADMIPVRHGEYFTIDEVLKALENEKAIDVYTVNLEGKSSLADYMVFCTGRSQAHMRRMADMLVTSIKARRLEDDFDYGVEGRDCDDWMITDCNNIVIHYMREDTRRILNLEEHWENMENDQHKIYGNMTEEEYMNKFGTSELMEYIEEDKDFHNQQCPTKEEENMDWR